MIRTRGRRRLTCHHEAGHAVARWWLWQATGEQIRADYLPVREPRRAT